MRNRMNPEYIDGLIKDVEYLIPEDSTLTVCVLTLTNGCTVTGKSNVIDPMNYSADNGLSAAKDNALNQIWELEGYALRRARTDLVLRAAAAAHEANRIYCLWIGDAPQPTWDDAPEWQKASVIAGVEAVLRNPKIGPEESHNGWLAQKRAEGWVWGPVKEPELKEHPCMVSYIDLPDEQKMKDVMFTRVVKAVLAD